MECQSNDLLLSSMLFEYSQNIKAEAILFKDHFQTNFNIPGVLFEKKIQEGNVRDDDRQYSLKQNDEVVASGGLINSLTQREIEIISFVKRGNSSKEIAKILHLAVKTVEVHRHNMLKKLNLKNTSALVNFINNSQLGI